MDSVSISDDWRTSLALMAPGTIENSKSCQVSKVAKHLPVDHTLTFDEAEAKFVVDLKGILLETDLPFGPT